MRIESVEGGLQLLHVDDHFALVIAARTAHAMGHLGLAAAGAGGEVDDMDMVVRTAAAAPRLRKFPLRIRHRISSTTPSAPDRARESSEAIPTMQGKASISDDPLKN